jgi:acyl dehydratase
MTQDPTPRSAATSTTSASAAAPSDGAPPARPADIDTVPRMGQGFYWQDLQVGQRLRTFRRTVTESDLVGFIGVTGMLEAIFIDADHEGGAIAGRPVPAALSYALIEGFILQSMIQGTGLAMLELQQKIHAPVCVGDTIEALVEVTGIRPTSRSGRAVVDSRISVFNQHGRCVMVYDARRLLAGRP